MIQDLIEKLKRLGKADLQHVAAELVKRDAPARALPQSERRKLAAELERVREDNETRTAQHTREHEEALADFESAKRRAGVAWAALSELNSDFRARRDAIVQQLRESMEPEVVAFIEEMSRELAGLPAQQQTAGFHIKHKSGGMDRTQRLVDNSASVLRRREAIRTASTAAERLSLEALDTGTLVHRLDALRAALPPVEDVSKLAAAARQREQEAIDAA